MELLNNQKTIGIITIISGILALACMIAGLIGVNYNFDAFSDPLLLLTMPNVNIEATRWFALFDMVGYYLLLLPIIYLLHEWMNNKTPWRNVITYCGLSYILIGAIGSAILAVVWPSILTDYPHATPEMQQILKANFKLFTDMVYGGLWNLLEVLLAGCWWLWTGILLYRNKYSFIGILTVATGISCLVDGAAGVFQLSMLHEIVVNIYCLLAIVWAVAIGIFLFKNSLK